MSLGVADKWHANSACLMPRISCALIPPGCRMEIRFTPFGIGNAIHLIRATLRIIYWKLGDDRCAVSPCEDYERSVTKENQLPTFHRGFTAVSRHVGSLSLGTSPGHACRLRLFPASFVKILTSDVPLSLGSSDWSHVYILRGVQARFQVSDRWQRDRDGYGIPWRQRETFDEKLPSSHSLKYNSGAIVTIGVESHYKCHKNFTVH